MELFYTGLVPAQAASMSSVGGDGVNGEGLVMYSAVMVAEPARCLGIKAYQVPTSPHGLDILSLAVPTLL